MVFFSGFVYRCDWSSDVCSSDLDFGFSKPFSVGWYAADEEGRLYRVKELYGCTGRPNEGCLLYTSGPTALILSTRPMATP